ncbi:hypothetical protein ACROYT_G029830 [Oculina patagonica]
MAVIGKFRRLSLGRIFGNIMWNPASFLHTFLLGFIYVSLACSRTLLIKLSIRGGGYEYLPVTVNIFAELFKLIVCCSLYLHLLLCKESKSAGEVLSFSDVNWRELLKWAVPGLLYFCDNLIGFYILLHLSAAVYILMQNFVIISTAVLFRIILRRKLSRVQWASLLILFLSIVSLSNEKRELEHPHHQRFIRDILPTEEVSTQNGHESNVCRKLRRTSGSRNVTDVIEEKLGVFRISQGHVLVMVQCVLSSSANIYNEKIFKEGQGMEESILLQNTKLYMFGVFFNTVSLFLRPEFRSHALNCGLFYGYNSHATLLIVVTAFFGLTVALILKFRDNMFQVMSNQLTNVVMITSSVLFLDFHPTLMFFLTAPVVLLAIFIFNAGGKNEIVSPREKVDTLL